MWKSVWLFCLLGGVMGCGEENSNRIVSGLDSSVGGTIDGAVLDSQSGLDGPSDMQLSSDGAQSDDGNTSCVPGEKRCDGAVAFACEATGRALHQVTCANGCLEGTCMPLSLSDGWVIHQYVLKNDSITTKAAYRFEQDGLVAVQTANPMASIYYKNTVFPRAVNITGRFSVKTSGDDDFVGFVFGFQDPEHTYLFDWKQLRQSYGACGLAATGATLKLIKSAVPLEVCRDLWHSEGTDNVVPLVPVEMNPVGWKDNAVYDFKLHFAPGNIAIEVWEGATKVVSINSNDTTYGEGKFGFYNYSQANVRYESFAISPSQ